MTKRGLGNTWSSFQKVVLLEVVEDGGHQEGEVQAVWEECSKLCSFSIFLHGLETGVMTRKFLTFHTVTRCMFLMVLVIIHSKNNQENRGLSSLVVF